jgi:hypothetical protein
MNDPEIKSPMPADLAGQIGSLQRQVMILLLALIVASGTLVFYLCYQAHIIGKQYDTVALPGAQIVKSYEQNETNIVRFVQQLQAYGQTHPDFQPILKKYGIPPAAPKK